ncbi:hypothetical protein HMPREF9163_02161 [Selenomonas sp. oral taxon 138 str. F0429]|nr:hypothetical protein HMPREF9163_02161 [Selenomonas sp. oral taxon 138 str. F0429]
MQIYFLFEKVVAALSQIKIRVFMDCAEKHAQEANYSFKEIQSRRLALLVAIALTGGSFAGATNAYAQDVVNDGIAQAIYGGFSFARQSTGRVYKNTVAINGGTVHGKVYGGWTTGAGSRRLLRTSAATARATRSR